ncbi:MAG: hypothetical protein WC081_03225 [Candidatus Ratteibacteria bacterium]|jgi:hypothetical protein
MNKKGAVLILSLIVLTLSLIMTVSLTGVVSNQGRNELRQAQEAELFAAAEGGIEEIKWRFINSVHPSGWTAGIPQHQIGNCLVTVSVTGPDANNYYLATSIAGFPAGSNLTRAVAIRAIPPGFLSFSQWMFFVNNAHLTIGTGAEVWGLIHSNRNIMIYGPGTIFHNNIEAVNNILYYNGASQSNTIYYGTHIEGAGYIPMPTSSQMADLKSYAQDGGYYSSGNLTVEFISDGTVKLNGGSPQVLPSSGVIYAEREINISGTVHGQVTVVSGRTINVTNNLKYSSLAVPPAPARPDCLGLIAEQNVYLPDSAPYNLEIDAAMLSRTGKAYAGLSSAKGTLIIRGAIAADTMSYFANTSGHGYNIRKYYYDNNLINYPPPHFLPAVPGAGFKDWRDMGG